MNMDLLLSYHSDSSDTPQEEEFSNKMRSEAAESAETLSNVDYFNLDCSSSDENSNSCKVHLMASVLSDKPYYPERSIPECLNSDGNSKHHTVNFHSSECSKFSTNEKYHGTIIASENAQQKKYVPDASAYKHDILVLPHKKQKTEYNRSEIPTSCGNLSKVNSSSLRTEYFGKENSSAQSERRVSLSAYEKIADSNIKFMPHDLPQKQVIIFHGHSAAVSALRWCTLKQKQLLLSGSLDSSLKVWDIKSKKMVQDISISSSRIKTAQWMTCGTKAICGGFDKKAHIVDVSSGKELMTYSFSSFVYSIEIHPLSQHLFVTGIKDAVLAFDTRSNVCEPIRNFESKCGQVLDVKFLKEDGSEFVCSTEIVSGDSSDRTIMAWDFASGAQLSNQIFHERYTCPFLQVDPSYQRFVAQTNGNYIAIFSAQRPYKMDKNKRYESHKVLGYPIGLDFSANGKFLVSGDAEGGLYIYWNLTTHLITKQDVKPGVPITQVKWHPYLHTTVATSSWDGDIQLWQ